MAEDARSSSRCQGTRKNAGQEEKVTGSSCSIPRRSTSLGASARGLARDRLLDRQGATANSPTGARYYFGDGGFLIGEEAGDDPSSPGS